MTLIKKILAEYVQVDTTEFINSTIGLNTSHSTLQSVLNKINELDLATLEKDGLLSKEDKIFIDLLRNGQSQQKIITTDRTLIQNDSITLNPPAIGDVVHNLAMIFDDSSTNIFSEVTASVSVDGSTVQFDSTDNLNGKYALVSYFGNIL
jgi:hypothetical protein